MDTAAHCEIILRSLPIWFGIESAIVEYVANIESLPTFLAVDGDDQAIGFMTVKRHAPESAELYVLAVREQWHRRGVGEALLKSTEEWLRREHVRFLQVKTLAPIANSEPYDRTRRFYQAMGFVPLEVFPTLWDPRNPCLQMIKSI
jgi:GNAT superfamily N-acetyltransferase